jgi:hypothetical protein
MNYETIDNPAIMHGAAFFLAWTGIEQSLGVSTQVVMPH